MVINNLKPELDVAMVKINIFSTSLDAVKIERDILKELVDVKEAMDNSQENKSREL